MLSTAAYNTSESSGVFFILRDNRAVCCYLTFMLSLQLSSEEVKYTGDLLIFCFKIQAGLEPDLKKKENATGGI